MLKRFISQRLTRTRKSVLLLGPRQTGKSTLMKSFRPELSINLAREAVYLQFARNPDELEQRLGHMAEGTILLDEVQRLPSLLNTVQAVIDEQPGRFRFLITGSSARKLRRGQANLLPGRVLQFYMAPLLVSELAGPLSLDSVLSMGTLPGIWTEEDRREKRETLSSYAAIYIKEEIQAEALSRNLEGFSRFLFVAATSATSFLDLAKLSSAAAIARTSAQRYFEILEDTLIFFRLDSYASRDLRRLVRHPRYFVFDNGVLNALLGSFGVPEDRRGMLFVNFIISQIYHLVQSSGIGWRLSSYRTVHGAEVDLIVQTAQKTFAIELKASRNIARHDLRGIRSFLQVAKPPVTPWILYQGDAAKRLDEVDILPWEAGLRQLTALATEEIKLI